PSDLAANQTATFDVELIYADASNVASYSITAESENYALVPEFPTMTPLLVALAIALVAAVIYKKKLTKL
ncbi:MAG: hypothetical protein NWF03_02090, partial [Candidatus Bathyarchaeota archaeon]|nr:hypothetical protein [Candidatus Bathyarchaeota archaeon]